MNIKDIYEVEFIKGAAGKYISAAARGNLNQALKEGEPLIISAGSQAPTVYAPVATLTELQTFISEHHTVAIHTSIDKE